MHWDNTGAPLDCLKALTHPWAGRESPTEWSNGSDLGQRWPWQTQWNRYRATQLLLPITTEVGREKRNSTAKQWGGLLLQSMFRQDHSFFPLGHLYQKMQVGSPKVWGFFLRLWRFRNQHPVPNPLSTGVVTKEVLETKLSQLIAVKVMTSLSNAAEHRCRSLYTAETIPLSGSKRKISWKPWEASEVSPNS